VLAGSQQSPDGFPNVHLGVSGTPPSQKHVLVGRAPGSARLTGSPREPRISRTLPTVEPILLTPRVDPFDDPAWLFEPKYNGYRCMSKLEIEPQR
jgi:ATP-dependent DNA ligase